jgi:hypothetical protein
MTQPPYPPQQPWGQPAPGPHDPAGAGQPHQPYPPQHGQPQHGQPQYGQPQYGQPQYGQPQYGQPQHGQPQYGQPQYGQPQQYQQPEQYPQPAPAKPKGRGKLIAGVAALVVLAGGGVATYAAFSDSSDDQAGASSPKAAVQKLVADLNNSDLLGVLDDLAPAEKRALADPIREDISTLKRLHVLNSGADPNKVSAVQFRASGVSYADKTVTVNDSVQVVTITGGTLRVSADAAKIPLTSQFLHAAFPGGGAPSGTSTATTDLGSLTKDGGQPLQVAVQKVDGRWYPSLFYTIAQNAAANAHAGAPSPSDRIAAAGAGTPEDAAKGLLLAATKGDWRHVIELTSPTEMAVLHDYGSLLLQNAPSTGSTGFTIDDVRFTSKDISGGKRLTATSMSGLAAGQQFSVTMEGDCYQVTIGGDQRKLCGSDLISQIAAMTGRGEPTGAQRTALTHLIHGVTQLGVDVSQSGGKWYIDPVRTVADEFGTALASLQGNDLLELITLFR